MCYLCEEYAPLEGLGKYESSEDPSAMDALITVHTQEATAEAESSLLCLGEKFVRQWDRGRILTSAMVGLQVPCTLCFELMGCG